MSRFVGRLIVRELVDKAPRVVPGADWQVHYVLFARAGFTDAARAEAERVDARLVEGMGNGTRMNTDEHGLSIHEP